MNCTDGVTLIFVCGLSTHINGNQPNWTHTQYQFDPKTRSMPGSVLQAIVSLPKMTRIISRCASGFYVIDHFDDS